MTDRKTALILGATGGAGFEIARALAARGWHLRALHRQPSRVSGRLPEADWIAGDAMNRGDVVAAATGTQLIVHAVNPPGYRNWQGLALPMLDNTIAAAAASGARIAMPGTVYNFGPDALPVVREDSPQNPLTRKGAIRVEMERRLRRAAEAGTRVLILRAGDFFGPNTGNSWFAQGVVKPGRPVRSVTYPGSPGVGHAWAYLPDFAETVARLVEQEDRLPAFAHFHFGGHWFERGIEIAERVRAVAGAPSAPIRKFPWTALMLLSPFVRLFREIREMRYLWTTPVRLDNSRLCAFLGAEPHTDTDTALGRTLQGLGCLPDAMTEVAGTRPGLRPAAAR